MGGTGTNFLVTVVAATPPGGGYAYTQHIRAVGSAVRQSAILATSIWRCQEF